MEQIKNDLRLLCSAEGVGGQTAIAEVAMELLKHLVDEVEVDVMGNVLGIRHADHEDAPTLMLEAHLDEIGFLVTHIDDNGFVYTAAAGGIDKRAITAQPVIVFGDEPYYGVFCSTPPHLSGKDGELPDVDKCGIDVGLSGEEAKKHIPIGSRVSYAPHFTELNENVVSSKALDDRAGIATILHCLRNIESGKRGVNIAVAFCVQEELGCRGVTPAVRHLQPTAAIVTDVSFALTPDANPRHCGKLGNGVMIGISPILSASDRLIALAKDNGIPYQYEVMGGSTGTDADRVSVSLMGVPTALLSIPQRYMHTPVETVDVRDIAATGDLMAAYIGEFDKERYYR